LLARHASPFGGALFKWFGRCCLRRGVHRIDYAACAIALCRLCSVVNALKELCIPLSRDASGEYYFYYGNLFFAARKCNKLPALFKMVRPPIIFYSSFFLESNNWKTRLKFFALELKKKIVMNR
jgi:hypothetical protein